MAGLNKNNLSAADICTFLFGITVPVFLSLRGVNGMVRYTTELIS